jgi:hypothetical protein
VACPLDQPGRVEHDEDRAVRLDARSGDGRQVWQQPVEALEHDVALADQPVDLEGVPVRGVREYDDRAA